MKFIALKSDKIDMMQVDECVRNLGTFEIVDTEEQLLDKIKEGVSTGDFYRAFFIYPADNSKKAFEIIKSIRKIEDKFETNSQAIIFVDSPSAIYLLEKFSLPTESFASSKIIKRNIIQILHEKEII